MKLLSLIIISACLVSPRTMLGQNQAVAPNVSSASSPSGLHAIKVTRRGSQRVTEGAATHFTGLVHIEPLFDANDPSRTVGASVTFEPGARTVWHTHPLGQTVIVTSGVGWIQQWGGPIEEIRKGDVVWIPPGTKHCHGATATNSMTYIAIVPICARGRRSLSYVNIGVCSIMEQIAEHFCAHLFPRHIVRIALNLRFFGVPDGI